MADSTETDQQASAPAKRPLEDGGAESLQIKVTFGKSSMTASRPATSTVAELKRDIEQHTGSGQCSEDSADEWERGGVAAP